MGHSNILERYQFFFPIGSAVLRKVRLNLTTTVTLGTEKSGHCREVETRVNVWTVRQKKIAVVGGWSLVEKWSLVEFRLYPHHTLYD